MSVPVGPKSKKVHLSNEGCIPPAGRFAFPYYWFTFGRSARLPHGGWEGNV